MSEVKNIIYQAQNKQRKCFYIGYSSRGLSSRKHTHKQGCFQKNQNIKFYNFLRKYGWDSFTWEILAVYPTKEELPEAERYWLIKEKKNRPDWEYLNMTEGGEGSLGHIVSDKQKQIQSIKMSGKNHPFWGKKRPEHSEKMKGKFLGFKHTEETRMKMRKPKSEEAKQHMRKPKTHEHNQKNSLAHMGLQVGKKNGMWGKHPIPWNKGQLKLSIKNISKIKELLLKKNITQHKIATIFNVADSMITKIKKEI
ncbi:MAG: GIY-YIG nuclease family protein [Patescibacteria group bacterium]|jgi:group I intron endonuclease